MRVIAVYLTRRPRSTIRGRLFGAHSEKIRAQNRRLNTRYDAD
jgi:hypothetical protein